MCLFVSEQVIVETDSEFQNEAYVMLVEEGGIGAKLIKQPIFTQSVHSS